MKRQMKTIFAFKVRENYKRSIGGRESERQLYRENSIIPVFLIKYIYFLGISFL